MQVSTDGGELVNAVHSIDEQIAHSCAMSHQYAPFVEQQCQDVHAYVDEVSVTSGGDSHCILGPEGGGGEICWNAILTDADLELCKLTRAARAA